MTTKEILYKLIRLAVGTEDCSVLPEEVDWEGLFKLSAKEGVGGLALKGLEKVFMDDASLSKFNTLEVKPIRNKWFSFAMKTEMQNKLQNSRIAEMSGTLRKDGFVSCILKGQGVAQLYPEPLARQCGDIDLWVQPAESQGIEKDRKKVLKYFRSKYETGSAVIHHVQVKMYKGASVEIHYLPAWLYFSPSNKKLQAFFREQAAEQFANYRPDLGFSIPKPLFNLVFSVIHLYKHTFEESVLLKQLVDYHYILLSANEKERKDAYEVLNDVGMGQFTAYLMYRLKNELNTPEEVLLCTPSSICKRPVKEKLSLIPWKIWHLIWRQGLK